ncbi:DUF4097 family beta strand repeat-containing protein [Virgibacillus sp. LDC-1]|uniref:DUF4097 family beta strand repeat-containing protein n=1 Tax=Virgibacillus sp. LDC-1 TaxID=3039856 RepID=UPI0024DE3911|nr:DUF4097 family beta strand repeat-containing protein [Virgibacillus sp. LDC-1]
MQKKRRRGSKLLGIVGLHNKSTFTQTGNIDATDLASVNIITKHANVEVTVHDAPNIVIRLHTYDGGPMLFVRRDGAVGHITAHSEETMLFSNTLTTARLQVTVPKNSDLSWDVQTSSGNMTIEELSGENINLAVQSGDIFFRKADFQNVRVKTTTGEIKGLDLAMEELRIETSSGDVRLNKITGNTWVKTNAGDIDVVDMEGDRIDLQSASGDIDMVNVSVQQAFSQTASGDIEAKDMFATKLMTIASSGDMVFQSFTGKAMGHSSSGDIRFILSENGALDLETSSGDITVRFEFAEVDAHVTIGTSSGKINTTLPLQIDEQKQLTKQRSGVIGNGTNAIRLASSSGDIRTFYSASNQKEPLV